MPKSSIETMKWKINNSIGNDAELIFYGDVVEKIPTQWWTGEKIDGNFIELDQFTKDIEELKTKDNITIRINSGGGDFFSGVTIHNLLKSLPAKKKVIIDGIAASAASIIACAGDEVQVYPGSMMMIHQAKNLMCGWFNVDDLTRGINRLNSAKESMTAIYKEKCKKDEAEIEQLIDAETWLVGQRAVDEGFANSVIKNYETDVEFKIENNGRIVIANGVKHDISAYKNFPKKDLNIKEENLIEKITNKVINTLAGKQATTGTEEVKNLVEEVVESPQNKTEREKEMCKNVEELRTAYPDLVAQVEKTASEQAKTQASIDERQRIQEIEEVQASIGDSELVVKAKFGKNEEVMNAKELAFLAMKSQQKQGEKYLANLEEDTATSKTDDVVTVPNSGSANNQTEEAQTAASMCEVFKTVSQEKNGGIK